MRDFLVWIRLVLRKLWNSPKLLWSIPVGAIVSNTRILFHRRGRKVLILSVEDATYLPFVQGALQKLPTDFYNKVMLVVACRRFATTEVVNSLQSINIPVEMAIHNWSCAAILLYDLYVSTHQSSVVPLLKRGERVCLFHGLPAKGGTFVPSQWRYFDGAFLIGPMQERMFKEFRQTTARSAQIWGRRIGLIKSDPLLNKEYNRIEILNSLDLSPALPTVLYAPSWEAGASLRTQGSEICEQLERQAWNTIVKLHPMSYFPATELNATGGIDWIKRLHNFEGEQFRHASRADITPLIFATDVLITDVSSVAFEAILIDKPVVFIDCPEFFEKTVQEMYELDANTARNSLEFNCGREAGSLVETLNDLIPAIQQAITNPQLNSVQRKLINSQLIFNPGHAANAAAEALVELLET